MVAIFSETSQHGAVVWSFTAGTASIYRSLSIMALQPHPQSRRTARHNTVARRDEKPDLGSGEREEWLTLSAEERPDRNGGRGFMVGIGGRRTVGINLEPTNHFSRNSETVNYQPVSQAGVVQLPLEASQPERQTRPRLPPRAPPRSIWRWIPHIPPSPLLTYVQKVQGRHTHSPDSYVHAAQY